MKSNLPFTPERLKLIFDEVLKGNTRRPPVNQLRELAQSLNLIHGVFTFYSTVEKQSRIRGETVRGALMALVTFFEERRQELLTRFPSQEAATGTRGAAETIEAEGRLYDSFCKFVQAMEGHPFNLDMDGNPLMRRELKNWHSLAQDIAEPARIALRFNNPTMLFGRSNDGPLPRFVAAVIPEITGERPSITAVGKHLKLLARKAKQK